jgi:hypothetical protein
MSSIRPNSGNFEIPNISPDSYQVVQNEGDNQIIHASKEPLNNLTSTNAADFPPLNSHQIKPANKQDSLLDRIINFLKENFRDFLELVVKKMNQ